MRIAVAISVVALAVAGRRAAADDEIARGAVVKVEAREVYVNLGTDRGVSDGAALRLKRAIQLHHPVTRAAVNDWIPIGSATVTQTGAVMSRAVIGELVDQVRVGDVAEVLVDRADRPPPVTPAGPPPPPVDTATAEVLNLFLGQVGQPIAVRIASWERYLSMRAGSPYAEAVRRDLETLHALSDEMKPPSAMPSGDAIATVAHNARTTTAAGATLPLVFVLDQPDRVASAFLHYRVQGRRTYQRLLLAREHEIYLRGALPAAATQAPGVEYFVEVSSPAGRSGLALGSPSEPIAIAIEQPPLIDRLAARTQHSTVRLSSEYLDFRTFDRRTGDRTDRLVAANVDFTYRIDSPVESVGVGYGVYNGAGGYADRVWSGSDPLPHTGFHYGYADVEVGGRAEHVHYAAGGQLIAGVGKDGFGLGAEGRVRIGDRDATNLALVARTIDQVGFLSDIRFSTRPTRAFAIGVSVGATNQPTHGDVGVKLGTELEVVAIHNVSLILRGSWQGRSTSHGGLGAGGGLGVTW